jgi:hypothetical protein
VAAFFRVELPKALTNINCASSWCCAGAGAAAARSEVAALFRVELPKALTNY